MRTTLKRTVKVLGVLALVGVIFGAGAMALYHQFGGRSVRDFCGSVSTGATTAAVMTKAREAGLHARGGKKGAMVVAPEGQTSGFQCQVDVQDGKVVSAHVYLMP